jgi:low affinity Fe/Cu permease
MANHQTPPKKNSLGSLFTHWARLISHATGRPAAFLTALAIIIIWAFTGPIFHFSDTWQLVINTGTTIITFLMVFLIQNAQNRDTEALQLKLDELIRSLGAANNEIMDLEEMDDDEMELLHQDYLKLARTARASLARHREKRKRG